MKEMEVPGLFTYSEEINIWEALSSIFSTKNSHNYTDIRNNDHKFKGVKD
jgi:hypothetical protein